MKWAMVLAVTGLILAGTAMAQGAPEGAAGAAPAAAAAAGAVGKGWSAAMACIGASLAVIGGAVGIGMIGSHSTEAIARQPEAAAQMFLAWLLPAAMIEGAMLFAVVVCLLTVI